jgi:hypothetical protein
MVMLFISGLMYRLKDTLPFSRPLQLMILLFLLFPSRQVDIFAQVKSTDEYQRAIDYLDSRDEVYLRIPLKDGMQANELSGFLSVDHISAGNIYAYADRAGFLEVVRRQITWHIEIPPSLSGMIRMAGDVFPDTCWNSYPSFHQYVECMHRYADSFPAICKLDTIGFSINNREILVLKISDQVGIEENEPEFFYTSTMHGDELTGYILMIRLTDWLLNRYGKDEKVTTLVDNLQIWINPLANPDGTYHSGNDSIYGATRFNANGVDLNRNFPDPDEGPHPDDNQYQPENTAMMDFMGSRHMVMSANLHTGSEVVNYPWDTWPELHPDDDWYRFISRQYADTAHLHNNQYMTQLDNGITNGYAWYSISGGRQDYVNYFLNGREVTLELSSEKIPPADTLPYLWEYNYRSLLNYMEQCLFGITGQVRDGRTDMPLKSMIGIEDHDDRNSHVWSDSLTGRYYRLIKEGVYNLLVSAEGYNDTLVSGVRVFDFQPTELNIRLFPYIPMEDETADSITVGPNPFIDYLRIDIWSEQQDVVSISLFDPRGRKVIPESRISIIQGENNLVLDCPGLTPGIYILKITRSSGIKKVKIIKLE